MLAFDDSQQRNLPEEEGENYFVSMTDMMVGILFIFIIMLMIFALQFQKQTDTSEDKLKDILKKIEEVTTHLDTLQDQISDRLKDLNQSRRERTRLLHDIERELKAVGLEVQIDPENGVLRLTENAIRFSTNRSNLDAEAQLNVQKVAHVLNSVLPGYTSCLIENGKEACRELPPGGAIDTVFVEGHTDKQGADTEAGDKRNWQLSTERAVSTYRALTKEEPALRTMRNPDRKEILSVSGYASTRPIPGTDNEVLDAQTRRAMLRQNRRIDIRFVMQVDPTDRLRDVLKLTNKMQSEIATLRKTIRAK
ncbi:OmpA family protein [uncultured Cohaesibacter sp.]|uniref:OmpA family protein n=1 Tax=uncultured Cohaesibacter sp. TaxID=1002546 RepID=UPI00292CFD60|nr:OmpA family protein [uncultured Cohaesibacter sp.]